MARALALQPLGRLAMGQGMAGGEGMAVHLGRGGRRTLYVASEHAPVDFVAIDVEDPRQLTVVHRHELPHAGVRSNNLAIHQDLLAVTRQVKRAGDHPAGVEFFDISDRLAPRSVGFFDAAGGASLGTHFVWLGADGFAYLASGAEDFVPRDPRDTFVLRILDVSRPERPVEVGRWWLPGLAADDDAPPPPRPAERLAAAAGVPLDPVARATRRVELGGRAAWDFGFRVHNIGVYPEAPDRAYLGCTSAGAFVLDIADRARPAVLGRLEYAPPLPGATHTVVPLAQRGFWLVSDETLEEGAADRPQGVWVVDARYQPRPIIIGALPLPWPAEVPAVGRYGAHNLHENPPGQGALRSSTLVAGAFFGLGMAVYDLTDPFAPREVGRFVPPADEPGTLAPQLNDVYVDDRLVAYAIDRRSDRLFSVAIPG